MKKGVKIALYSVVGLITLLVVAVSLFIYIYKIKNGFPVSYETDRSTIDFPTDKPAILLFSKTTGFHEWYVFFTQPEGVQSYRTSTGIRSSPAVTYYSSRTKTSAWGNTIRLRGIEQLGRARHSIRRWATMPVFGKTLISSGCWKMHSAGQSSEGFG